MRRHFYLLPAIAGLSLSTIAGLSSALGQTAPPALPHAPGVDQFEPAGDQPEMDVLERGPVHEAFAEPIALDIDDQTAEVVDQAPPEPIDELPPEMRPDGDNVQWIPGYWMFSDEVNDFVWVSGVWRQLPPGRQWTPGHWAKAGGGFQWIAGFWSGAGAQQVQYLPQPPATLEVGPNIAAPGDNYFWIPGCWTWQQTSYAWRAGYWYQGHPNWIWIPDHYVYTPRGCVFVTGYWDYPLVNRGLLFAPVYWPGYRGNSIVRYRPQYVVNSSLLLASLFIHNGNHHYHYGHYDNYGRYGLEPWYDIHNGRRGRRGYDPFYAYHNWHDGRRDSNWADRYRHGGGRGDGDWNGRGDGRGRGRDGAQGGVPDQIVLDGNRGGGNRREAGKPVTLDNKQQKLKNMVVPLGQVSQTKVTERKVRQTTDLQQRESRQQITNWQQLASQRNRQELMKKESKPTVGQDRLRGTPDIVQYSREKLGKNTTSPKYLGGDSTQKRRAIDQGRPDMQRRELPGESTGRDRANVQRELLQRQLQQRQLEGRQFQQRERQNELQQNPIRDQRRTANDQIFQQEQAVRQHLQKQGKEFRELQNQARNLGDATPGRTTQGPQSWQNFYRGRQTTQPQLRQNVPQQIQRGQGALREAQPRVIPGQSPQIRQSPQVRRQPQRQMQTPRTIERRQSTPQVRSRAPQQSSSKGAGNQGRSLNNRTQKLGKGKGD